MGGREGGGYDVGRTLITYIRSHNFMSVPTSHTYQPTQPRLVLKLNPNNHPDRVIVYSKTQLTRLGSLKTKVVEHDSHVIHHIFVYLMAII